MTTRIYLGKVKKGATEFLSGEAVYLTKHQWDCKWYWAFGYIGNSKNHCHFDGQFLGRNPQMASELFEETPLTDTNWWVIRDLFVQAYALKKAAEVYQYGGHQTTVMGLTDMIRNPDKAKALNADLERVLDALWEYVSKAVNHKQVEAV